MIEKEQLSANGIDTVYTVIYERYMANKSQNPFS